MVFFFKHLFICLCMCVCARATVGIQLTSEPCSDLEWRKKTHAFEFWPNFSFGNAELKSVKLWAQSVLFLSLGLGQTIHQFLSHRLGCP